MMRRGVPWGMSAAEKVARRSPLKCVTASVGAAVCGQLVQRVDRYPVDVRELARIEWLNSVKPKFRTNLQGEALGLLDESPSHPLGSLALCVEPSNCRTDE